MIHVPDKPFYIRIQTGRRYKMEKEDMIYGLSLPWSTVKDIFPYFDRLSRMKQY